MDAPNIVSEIVRDHPADVHAVLHALRAVPGIEELDGPIAFRICEHEIHVGLKAGMERQRDMLEKVRALDLAIAPEVVALHPIGDEEAALLLRYRACRGEHLLPVRAVDGPIPPESFARAKRDIAKLGSNGFVHRYAGRGAASWLASDKQKTLVLSGWTSLAQGSAKDGESMCEQVNAVFSKL
jgi:hypothetical protein